MKFKAIKTILIPTLGISAIGTIATVCTSCGNVIHATGVTLNKTTATLAVGNTLTLTATVSPEDATDKLVTWTSDNESVATVDSNGKITAVAEGTATITVKTNDGDKTATCSVTVDDSSLSFIHIAANADSTLGLVNNGGNNPDLQYSTDGENWRTAYGSDEINIAQGKHLYLKGNNSTGWSTSDSVYSTLSITGDVSISGNVMGLLDNGAASEKEGDITDIPCSYCFYELFKNSTGITSVSGVFLPAKTLAYVCYNGMFYGCTSLTTAPELPAKTLASYCYLSMFLGCTSLTTAPELPATTLADYCYSGMFHGCTSLTTAPELPATTLVDHCYSSMFEGCSALTAAPELPAKTLVDDCYTSMFYDCTSLNSIKIGYTGNYSPTYFSSWVIRVADSGTFYYNGSQTAQDFQLPSGWTKTPILI